jgi:peptidoglycan/xylan/chitin deacetylase (PgdA/CDA1 family)
MFFMLGKNVVAPAGRAAARQVLAAGHRVGNHTMTHRTPLGCLPAAQAVSEIRDANEALAEFLEG